jgi:predicted phage terminase large subunit-like protein
MASLREKTTAEIQRDLLLLVRQQKVIQAREGMLAFGHFMMPDKADPDDAAKSEYQVSAPAICLCHLIEDIEAGIKKRVGVSMPPQHGKTINLSILGAAWILGRNPRVRIVIATYNETRAKELGKDLLALLRTTQYKQVFPDVRLDPSVQNQLYIQTLDGGRIMLAGAGGSITGKTADYFLIDDPIKGEDDESDLTPTALERLWGWFFKVAFSRGSSKTRMLITHTRWAEDDLLGRLCDPNHPERNKRFRGIADKWFYLNLPAVIKDKELAEMLGLELKVPTNKDVIEMFGVDPMTALWPENKDVEFFAEWKRGDARSFSALAMGSPAPEDGAYYLKDWLVEYEREALPSMDNLRIYAASDHAVSTKQGRDYTVLGCVGIDSSDNIWVLPDLVWDRMETDRTVEEMLGMIKRNKPQMWWIEDEMISKSFGPFLIKRMHEERIYCTFDPIRPAADKKVRGRASQGRASMKKIFFPNFAPWWPDAKAQLLRFPHAAHDDFADWLSTIGLGLTKEVAADVRPDDRDKVVRVGSIEWIMADTRRRAMAEQQANIRNGW